MPVHDTSNNNYISEQYVAHCHILQFNYRELAHLVLQDIPCDVYYNHIIHSMHVMILHLAPYDGPTSAKQYEHIHLFLDHTHWFCSMVYNDSIKLTWLFKSFLNLPKQIEQLGPLYSYWKGPQSRKSNQKSKSNVHQILTWNSKWQMSIWIQ